METIKFEAPNLTEMIQNTLANELSEEKLQVVINKCCADVVKDAVEKQFSRHGKLKEQLEDHVKNTINVDTKLLPVPEYTNLVAQGFKNALAGMEDEKIIKDAEKLLESILKSAPKEINLSDLAKKYTDEISDKFESDLKDLDTQHDDDGCITFELRYSIEDEYPETSCLSNYKTLTLQCDEISDDSHRLVLSVRVEKDGTGTLSHAMRDRKHPTDVREMEMKDWSQASSLSQLLYKMINQDTKIIMDEDDIQEEFSIQL